MFAYTRRYVYTRWYSHHILHQRYEDMREYVIYIRYARLYAYMTAHTLWVVFVCRLRYYYLCERPRHTPLMPSRYTIGLYDMLDVSGSHSTLKDFRYYRPPYAILTPPLTPDAHARIINFYACDPCRRTPWLFGDYFTIAILITPYRLDVTSLFLFHIITIILPPAITIIDDTITFSFHYYYWYDAHHYRRFHYCRPLSPDTTTPNNTSHYFHYSPYFFATITYYAIIDIAPFPLRMLSPHYYFTTHYQLISLLNTMPPRRLRDIMLHATPYAPIRSHHHQSPTERTHHDDAHIIMFNISSSRCYLVGANINLRRLLSRWCFWFIHAPRASLFHIIAHY